MYASRAVANTQGSPLVSEVWLVILVGVVLICTLVVLIIHVLSRSLCVSLCLNLVIFVHSLSLSESVDFTANDAGKQLLSESVVDNLA